MFQQQISKITKILNKFRYIILPTFPVKRKSSSSSFSRGTAFFHWESSVPSFGFLASGRVISSDFWAFSARYSSKVLTTSSGSWAGADSLVAVFSACSALLSSICSGCSTQASFSLPVLSTSQPLFSSVLSLSQLPALLSVVLSFQPEGSEGSVVLSQLEGSVVLPQPEGSVVSLFQPEISVVSLFQPGDSFVS